MFIHIYRRGATGGRQQRAAMRNKNGCASSMFEYLLGCPMFELCVMGANTRSNGWANCHHTHHTHIAAAKGERKDKQHSSLVSHARASMTAV